MNPRRVRFPFLLLALLWCVPARAALVGSILSGPTTGDGAAIYWNPGAMTLSEGTFGLAFGAISAIRLHYARDLARGYEGPNVAYTGTEYPQANVFVPKPNIAFGLVTDATTDKFRFGLGFSLPIIDGASWDEAYGGQPASTRFYAVRARLAILKISPAVAYKINRYISVGAGMDIVGIMLTSDMVTDFGAKVNQIACDMNAEACLMNAPFAREDPALDAPTKIDGFGWGVGAFFGVLITPTRWLRLGAGFHTGAGTVSIPVELGVEIPKVATDYLAKNWPSIKLPPLAAEGYVDAVSPMIATAGVAVLPSDKLELAFDMHWFDYSATSMLVGTVTAPDKLNLITDQVLIKARTDGYLFGIRGSYRLLQSLIVALRFEYEPNTRPDAYITPVSVDFHKFSFHVGAAWQPLRWLTISLEYGHYIMPDRVIDSGFTCTSGKCVPNQDGVYASNFAPNPKPQGAVQEGFDKPPPTGRYFVEADRVGLGVAVSF
jgi:long-chain fatty acid transport protein